MKLQTEKHYLETKDEAKELTKEVIAKWLLEEWYFPEQNVLPPQFKVVDFLLNDDPYFQPKPTRVDKKDLLNISYPKNDLTNRTFWIQYPHYYHDLVYHIATHWDEIVKILFPEWQRIYSYSFPVPLYHKKELRAWRMVYEWLQMAEWDLVADSFTYQYIVRTDIKNFYNSVYTHIIPWVLTSRSSALSSRNTFDDTIVWIGNKIDRLLQYSNDQRTIWLPIGSAVDDLIAEIILSKIDLEASEELEGEGIDFVATRFKDDYRFLCNSEEDAKRIMKVLWERLNFYNLTLNEKKTDVLSLPEWLYRWHIREYSPYSLKEKESISFKEFELVLLKTLEIHDKYPWTSIIEKFLSELYDNDYNIKISFHHGKSLNKKYWNIKKSISLILSLYRKSRKSIGSCLALILAIYEAHSSELFAEDLSEYIEVVMNRLLDESIESRQVFDLLWIIFFFGRMWLVIDEQHVDVIKDHEFFGSPLLESLIEDEQRFFVDSGLELFVWKEETRDLNMVKELDIFYRKPKQKDNDEDYEIPF